jgi:hypothetical protein
MTRVAVHGGVGGQLGRAEDDVIRDGAAAEDVPEVCPDLADLAGPTALRDRAGTHAGCCGDWREHGSVSEKFL